MKMRFHLASRMNATSLRFFFQSEMSGFIVNAALTKSILANRLLRALC